MWGYTKVNARTLLGGNSVGVHSFLPVEPFWVHSLASYYWEDKSAGVHCTLPVSKLGEKSARVHSFFPVVVRFRTAIIVWGYTLSCLLVSGEGRVQGYTLSFQY